MRNHDLDALAETHVVEAGAAPAAVVAVARRTAQGFRFATGAAGVRSPEHPTAVDPGTPFDLASVTKPFVAAAVARLVRRGALSWRTPVAELLPELAGTASAGVPVILLASHRAGLDAHRALYAPLLSGGRVERGPALASAAEARRPDCGGEPPAEGFPPLYSDLGYLLLGALAERVAGADLATVVTREVGEPLELRVDSSERMAPRFAGFLDRVAPTEKVPFRGGLVIGCVHDENAWAVVGRGLAGHAGLFGTALDVARFGAAMVDALAGRLPEWLTAGEARTLVEPRPGGTLRAGFDGKSEEGSSAGPAFGPRSFGHLGFTGTSLWCDPDAELVSVILTNRVCPTRDNVSIRKVRPELNEALARVGAALGTP
jgi:serine-type D-Ala-D-Ala carboxypeptidase